MVGPERPWSDASFVVHRTVTAGGSAACRICRKRSVSRAGVARGLFPGEASAEALHSQVVSLGV